MKFWRVLFLVAGLYNFLAALPMLLVPEAMLAAVGQPVPDSLLVARMAAWLIICFGVGYLMAARDPVANRSIIWLGAVGKAPIAFFVWLDGGAAVLGTSSFLLALGDLVFVALFLVYLFAHPKPRAA